LHAKRDRKKVPLSDADADAPRRSNESLCVGTFFAADFPDTAEIVVNNPRLCADEKCAILADNAAFFRRIAA
jgi:hypothetical protein